MKFNKVRLLAAGFSLLVLSIPAMAHHSFAAEYDAKKPVTLKGVVTKIDWMNPHVYFYIDVEDDKGKVTTWGLEMGPPQGLQRAGWTRNTMKIGDEVRGLLPHYFIVFFHEIKDLAPDLGRVGLIAPRKGDKKFH